MISLPCQWKQDGRGWRQNFETCYVCINRSFKELSCAWLVFTTMLFTRHAEISKNAYQQSETNLSHEAKHLSSTRFDPTMAAIIDNMEVITPKDFIMQNFNSVASPTDFANPFESMSKLWKGNLHPKESDMYPLLVCHHTLY